MKFTISKEIEDIIKRGKAIAFMRCQKYGHDYREVDEIDVGKICVYCGYRPNKPVQRTQKAEPLT